MSRRPDWNWLRCVLLREREWWGHAVSSAEGLSLALSLSLSPLPHLSPFSLFLSYPLSILFSFSLSFSRLLTSLSSFLTLFLISLSLSLFQRFLTSLFPSHLSLLLAYPLPYLFFSLSLSLKDYSPLLSGFSPGFLIWFLLKCFKYKQNKAENNNTLWIAQRKKVSFLFKLRNASAQTCLNIIPLHYSKVNMLAPKLKSL